MPQAATASSPFEFFLLAAPSLVIAIALIFLLRKRTRGKAGKAILVSLAVFITGIYLQSTRLDAEARDHGYLDTSDWVAAEDAGYATAFAWAPVRETVLAENMAKAAEEKLASEVAARRSCVDDSGCWINRHLRKAAKACAIAIEQLARNSFEWQSNVTEDRFSLAVIKSDGALITYIGDAISFQNVFGADNIHTYECDYQTASDRVLDVRASRGRLPAS